MIVKFFFFVKRTTLYKARKNAEVKIHLDIIQNHVWVSQMRQKKLFDEDTAIDFVFVDINCNTVVKMKNGSYLFLDDIESFEKNY